MRNRDVREASLSQAASESFLPPAPPRLAASRAAAAPDTKRVYKREEAATERRLTSSPRGTAAGRQDGVRAACAHEGTHEGTRKIVSGANGQRGREASHTGGALMNATASDEAFRDQRSADSEPLCSRSDDTATRCRRGSSVSPRFASIRSGGGGGQLLRLAVYGASLGCVNGGWEKAAMQTCTAKCAAVAPGALCNAERMHLVDDDAQLTFIATAAGMNCLSGHGASSSYSYWGPVALMWGTGQYKCYPPPAALDVCAASTDDPNKYQMCCCLSSAQTGSLDLQRECPLAELDCTTAGYVWKSATKKCVLETPPEGWVQAPREVSCDAACGTLTCDELRLRDVKSIDTFATVFKSFGGAPGTCYGTVTHDTAGSAAAQYHTSHPSYKVTSGNVGNCIVQFEAASPTGTCSSASIASNRRRVCCCKSSTTAGADVNAACALTATDCTAVGKIWSTSEFKCIPGPSSCAAQGKVWSAFQSQCIPIEEGWHYGGMGTSCDDVCTATTINSVPLQCNLRMNDVGSTAGFLAAMQSIPGHPCTGGSFTQAALTAAGGDSYTDAQKEYLPSIEELANSPGCKIRFESTVATGSCGRSLGGFSYTHRLCCCTRAGGGPGVSTEEAKAICPTSESDCHAGRAWDSVLKKCVLSPGWRLALGGESCNEACESPSTVCNLRMNAIQTLQLFNTALDASNDNTKADPPVCNGAATAASSPMTSQVMPWLDLGTTDALGNCKANFGTANSANCNQGLNHVTRSRMCCCTPPGATATEAASHCALSAADCPENYFWDATKGKCSTSGWVESEQKNWGCDHQCAILGTGTTAVPSAFTCKESRLNAVADETKMQFVAKASGNSYCSTASANAVANLASDNEALSTPSMFQPSSGTKSCHFAATQSTSTCTRNFGFTKRFCCCVKDGVDPVHACPIVATECTGSPGSLNGNVWDGTLCHIAPSPTSQPTTAPSHVPTSAPTKAPNNLSSEPTTAPSTSAPSSAPTTNAPSVAPTMLPTSSPTYTLGGVVDFDMTTIVSEDPESGSASLLRVKDNAAAGRTQVKIECASSDVSVATLVNPAPITRPGGRAGFDVIGAYHALSSCVLRSSVDPPPHTHHHHHLHSIPRHMGQAAAACDTFNVHCLYHLEPPFDFHGARSDAHNPCPSAWRCAAIFSIALHQHERGAVPPDQRCRVLGIANDERRERSCRPRGNM